MALDARQMVRLFAVGRIGIGLALLTAPRTAIRVWLGTDRVSPATDVLARGLGARDLAIGVGLIRALGEDDRVDGERVARWLDAAALADAGDAAGVLFARRHLEPAIVASAGIALGAAVGGLVLKRALSPG